MKIFTKKIASNNIFFNISIKQHSLKKLIGIENIKVK